MRYWRTDEIGRAKGWCSAKVVKRGFIATLKKWQLLLILQIVKISFLIHFVGETFDYDSVF